MMQICQYKHQIKKPMISMQNTGHRQSLCLKKYLFTVSNLSHELVTPQQYTQIISTVSQYQVIPGFLSDSVEQPWEVVLSLLPYSRQTLLDITLPYQQDNLQTRILARYLLFRQTVIGVKICTSSYQTESAINQSRQKLTSKFEYRMTTLPNKILEYYQKNNIRKYCLQIPVGDFYLVTNKTKIALLFQSQIKRAQQITPYLQLGCQIISIVNDLEYNYEQFINNFSTPSYRNTIQHGYSSTILKISQKCKQTNAALIYGGCRTSPSLGKIYYSGSFIDCMDCQQGLISNLETEFMPIVDLSKQINFIDQHQINLNRINISQTCRLGVMRSKRRSFVNSFKEQKPIFSTSQSKQYPTQFEMDRNNYDLRPLTGQNLDKLNFRLHTIRTLIQGTRQKLFKSISIQGGSMIRCMYVFNLLNLFIFSKKKGKKSPLSLGVPFTRKGQNLFNTIVFIYDNLKQFQVRFPDLQYKIQLNDIVQVYRYKNQPLPSHSSSQFNLSAEQHLLSRLTGTLYKIPMLEQLLHSHNKLKPFLLCSDDLSQRRKLRQMCRQKDIQLRLIDLFIVDEFNQELDVRSVHSRQVQDVLQLQEVNVLQKYKLQLRQVNYQDQEMNNMKDKKHEYPPKYTKLCQQVLHRNFTSIKQALQFIIIDKAIQFQPDNIQILKDLIIRQLGKKYRNNVKTLSPIHKFFISNTQDQIIRRVMQLGQQLMQQKRSNSANIVNLSGSLAQGDNPIKPILISDSQQQINQNNNKSVINVNSKEKGSQKASSQKQQQGITIATLKIKTQKPQPQKQKTQQQLYGQRLEGSRLIISKKKRKIIAQCHRCQTQMHKKFIQKCSKCSNPFCVQCIQQITGISGINAMKQWNKLCVVCRKVCQCQKCNKRNKNQLNSVNNDKSSNGRINLNQAESEQLKKSLFNEGDNAQKQMIQQKNGQCRQVNYSLTQNSASLLFNTFTFQNQLPQFTVQPCQKCMILNPGQMRHISLQCILCCKQQCYFCIQQLYKLHNYKPINKKWFYKSWKCCKCDMTWSTFLDNEKIQKQRQNKRITNDSKMIRQIDEIHLNVECNGSEQIASDHTSHYANEQVEIQEFQQFQQFGQLNQRTQTFSRNSDNKPLLQAYKIKVQQKQQELKPQLQFSSRQPLPYFSHQPSPSAAVGLKGVQIVFPSPKLVIKSLQKQKTPQKTKQQPRMELKMKRVNSSDSAYDSNYEENRTKRQRSQQRKTPKSNAKWGDKTKTKRSESNSSSKSKEKSLSQYSFKQTKYVQAKNTSTVEKQPRQRSRQKIKQLRTINSRVPQGMSQQKKYEDKILSSKSRGNSSCSSPSKSLRSSSSKSKQLSDRQNKNTWYREDSQRQDRRGRNPVPTNIHNPGSNKKKQTAYEQRGNRVQTKGDSFKRDFHKDRSGSGSKSRDYQQVSRGGWGHGKGNTPTSYKDTDERRFEKGRFNNDNRSNYRSNNYANHPYQRRSQNHPPSTGYSHQQKPPKYPHTTKTVIDDKDKGSNSRRYSINANNSNQKSQSYNKTGRNFNIGAQNKTGLLFDKPQNSGGGNWNQKYNQKKDKEKDGQDQIDY